MVDLGGLKARQEHIEAQINKALQLDCEDLVIPACLLNEAIVSKDISLLLGLTEMRTKRTVGPSSYSAALLLRPDHGGDNLVIVVRREPGCWKPKRSILRAILL